MVDGIKTQFLNLWQTLKNVYGLPFFVWYFLALYQEKTIFLIFIEQTMGLIADVTAS